MTNQASSTTEPFFTEPFITNHRHPFVEGYNGIDDWVQRIVDIHFDAKHGSPFWLARAKELKIDAKKDLRTYADLSMFGLLDTKLLKKDVSAMMPAHLANDPKNVRVYETGGTTGTPARVAMRSYSRLPPRWVAWYLHNVRNVPKDVSWNLLWIGPPGGPHQVGDHFAELGWSIGRGGLTYFIDLDPRFVKRLVLANDTKTLHAYMDHIKEQALDILKTQRIDALGTTPAILERFAPELVDLGIDFKLLFYAGTTLSKDLYQLLTTHFFPNAIHQPMYGNTLMGMAPARPYREDSLDVVYYPLEPYFRVDVVDPANPMQPVKYRESGQARVTLMCEDLLLINVPERDKLDRWEPLPELGAWDGVANVRPLEQKNVTATEGVY